MKFKPIYDNMLPKVKSKILQNAPTEEAKFGVKEDFYSKKWF